MACIFHEMPYVFERMNIQSFYAACRYVYTHKILRTYGVCYIFYMLPVNENEKNAYFCT